MGTCTFFGHSDCYGLEEEKLRAAIAELIEQGIDIFYVGNHGGFDSMVHTCLRQLSGQYPQIRYSVVLAYLPGVKREGGGAFRCYLPGRSGAGAAPICHRTQE